MRRIATAVLRLPNGNIVLQRRSVDFKRSPGKLGFFGGHIEAGETPLQAAKRELQEETCLSVETLNFTEFAHVVMQPDATDDNPVEHTIFLIDIPEAKFEVFEGDGFEVYTIKQVLARDDITRSTRFALTKLGKE